jgi:hypothetical protein
MRVRRSISASASLLGLGDDLLRLVLRALEQGGAILVGRLRLLLILGLERLAFLAQRFGFGELIADQRDLAVERLAIAPGPSSTP